MPVQICRSATASELQPLQRRYVNLQAESNNVTEGECLHISGQLPICKWQGGSLKGPHAATQRHFAGC